MFFQLFKTTSISKLLFTLILLSLFTTSVWGHGLMQSPASRNQFCGVLTKPDEAANGNGLNPECAAAFAQDFTGGYSFMSVLTHAQGRKVVSPLPSNVCGFDAETWNGGKTPWDNAIDWPVNTMQAGTNEIIWNISWGPHFDDTEEFVYWITKEDFVYQEDVELSWDDFESTPFCDLSYDDSDPTANPNVVADKSNALFYTYCDVPERTGRHVIYGEWGRNQFTFERFHGCIDAEFSGDQLPDIKANIDATPNGSVTGEGVLQLDASASVGENLSYQWSISGGQSEHYSFSSTTALSPTLTYADPADAATITILLSVSDGNTTDSSTYSFEHLPSGNTAIWLVSSPLTASALTLTEGDVVTVRSVDGQGNDSYSTALTIDSANSAADIWPYQLAQLIGDQGDIAIGVLAENGLVTPVFDATANTIYTRIGADIAGVFLNVQSASTASCEFIVTNEWNTGYTASIRINNTGTTDITDWTVTWALQQSQISNLWNADFTAGNPNTASNLSWNGNIAVGQSVEFGFNANKNMADSAAEIAVVSGQVCH